MVTEIKNAELYKKVKLISNKKRFQIIELTQNKVKSITELSTELNLSYSKTADYVTLLSKNKLVSKKKQGKETLVRSNTKLYSEKIYL